MRFEEEEGFQPPSRDEVMRRLQERARAGLPGASDFHQYTLF